MKFAFMAVPLVWSLNSFGYPIDFDRHSFYSAGSGVIQQTNQAVNSCVKGNRVFEAAKPVVTYSLKKIVETSPYGGLTNRTTIRIQMDVQTNVLKLENIKADSDLRQYSYNARRFKEVCGDGYVSQIMYGGSYYILIFTTTEDAKDVAEFQVIERDTSTSLSKAFLDLALATVKNVPASGGGAGSKGARVSDLFSGKDNYELFENHRKAFLDPAFAARQSKDASPVPLSGEMTLYPQSIIDVILIDKKK